VLALELCVTSWTTFNLTWMTAGIGFFALVLLGLSATYVFSAVRFESMQSSISVCIHSLEFTICSILTRVELVDSDECFCTIIVGAPCVGIDFEQFHRI
jgi:hypothetical protein